MIRPPPPAPILILVPMQAIRTLLDGLDRSPSARIRGNPFAFAEALAELDAVVAAAPSRSSESKP